MNTLIETLKKWKELLGLILVFGTILVVPARIYAEDFINKTVNDEITALELQITALTAAVGDAPTSEQLKELTDLLKQQMALIQFVVSSQRRALEP